MNSSESQFSVYLGERLVGRILYRDDFTRFFFDDEYWLDAHRPILGLRFENNRFEKNQSRMRLPPWFSNLLPEGRLRNWIAEARGTSIQREMELLAQVGHDLPGAVRIIPTMDVLDVELSKESTLTGGENYTNNLWKFSLAGVGMKFSMVHKGDRLTLPATGDDGDWIVKIPDGVHADVPRNEIAMMGLAKSVGIEVPEVRLVHRDLIDSLPNNIWAGNEYWAYAIKRFDRGPGKQRIHIEDMAQVRGFYPECKYNGSFETVANLIYRKFDDKGIEEFVRRLVFNILIGNGDAHLKNWSLIYKNGNIAELAPAYDLVSTFVYRPQHENSEDMALRFGYSKRFEDVRISTFDRLAKSIGSNINLGDVASSVISNIFNDWHIVEDIMVDNTIMLKEIKMFIQERVKQFGDNLKNK